MHTTMACPPREKVNQHGGEGSSSSSTLWWPLLPSASPAAFRLAFDSSDRFLPVLAADILAFASSDVVRPLLVADISAFVSADQRKRGPRQRPRYQQPTPGPRAVMTDGWVMRSWSLSPPCTRSFSSEAYLSCPPPPPTLQGNTILHPLRMASHPKQSLSLLSTMLPHSLTSSCKEGLKNRPLQHQGDIICLCVRMHKPRTLLRTILTHVSWEHKPPQARHHHHHSIISNHLQPTCHWACKPASPPIASIPTPNQQHCKRQHKMRLLSSKERKNNGRSNHLLIPHA